ncbi:hypothetical protein [Archangium lansingense]|uniref:Big-1 domain-containing protein n=1 Tax=Archangium lansingense TaxID=2995310 RepID=A0ABT4AC46_9BACT|nr:hypothetical protein [Archangium lansinium]MCY1078474.1 hypothetical protein [Archangium lansinium]
MPLPQAFVVRAKNNSDAGVAVVSGVEVTFSVLNGGGTLSADRVVTDENGLARTTFTPGSAVGDQYVQAAIGESVVVFVTPVRAAGPQAFLISRGDMQQAAPGTPVAISPSVLVRDAWDRPLAGAEVSFSVLSGGGTVGPAVVRTNEGGVAAVDSWVLGSARGLNTLRAADTAGHEVLFTALAAPAPSPDISLFVRSPVANTTVDQDTLEVTVDVFSRFQLRRIQATFGSRTFPVDLSAFNFPCGSRWCTRYSASLPLDGEPAGRKLLTLSARDEFGGENSELIVFHVDRPPALKVQGLSHWGVVQSETVTIDVTCVDDAPAGCASLELRARGNSTPLASGSNRLTYVLDARPYDGGLLEVQLTGTDALGRRRDMPLVLPVELAPGLTKVASAPEGAFALDFGGSRVAYKSPVVDVVGLLDVATSVDARLGSGYLAWVTPFGAIWQDRGSICTEFRHSGYIRFPNGGVGVHVNGPYAIYQESATPFNGALKLYDTLSGRTDHVADSSEYADVSASGDVVYERYGSVYRYRAGSSTLLKDARQWPLTDGINVAVAPRGSGTARGLSIILADGSEVPLAEPREGLRPRTDYQVANGWTAFRVPFVSNGNLGIWVRSPSGDISLVSLPDQYAWLEALAPDGRVVYASAGRRYLAAAGSVPVDVGAEHGIVKVREDRLLLLLGRDVLEMQ